VPSCRYRLRRAGRAHRCDRLVHLRRARQDAPTRWLCHTTRAEDALRSILVQPNARAGVRSLASGEYGRMGAPSRAEAPSIGARHATPDGPAPSRTPRGRAGHRSASVAHRGEAHAESAAVAAELTVEHRRSSVDRTVSQRGSRGACQQLRPDTPRRARDSSAASARVYKRRNLGRLNVPGRPLIRRRRDRTLGCAQRATARRGAGMHSTSGKH